MASIVSLESELKKLGALSKRHSGSLAEASEVSLGILSSLAAKITEEQKAIYELRNHPAFVTPFILACSESSAKSCASALQCIQTLASYRGIAPSKLADLLAALMEATQLGLGIQLKILQVLPVLLFEFSSELSGKLVVDLLAVCTELLGSNKVAMVHNAAYATLQQLINGIFDRTDLPGDEELPNEEIVVDGSRSVRFETKAHLHDSAMILVDLCDIAEGQKPSFSHLSGLSLTFTLELLELTLSNQAALIHKYDELASILRIRVVPLLLRLFREASEFPIVLRATRLFYLLLRQHLQILTTESEVILSTITQQCSPPGGGALWKRSLCLEVLQGLFLEVQLLLDIYNTFDTESRRASVINTIIVDFAGSLADSKAINELNRGGSLSRASSSLPSPIIEMLDHTDPPVVPKAYPHYVILKCINSFSDDIHKLIAGDARAKQLLIDTSASLTKCYASALKINMDVDLFRLVVRAVQRLAHASGIVSLKTTRDDFIKLLAVHSLLPEAPPTNDNHDALQRRSLCVRALFNLGYALGNQLNSSWHLITNTITSLNSQIPHPDPVSLDNIFGNFAPDYSTINLAMRKLMESSVRLSDQALQSFMVAVGEEPDSIKYEILRNIAVLNESRVADPELSIWETFSDIVLHGVKQNADVDEKTDNDKNTSSSGRDVLNTGAVSVLSDVSAWIVNYTSMSMEDPIMIDKSLAMVIASLCSAVIQSPNLSVKISCFQHLNGILEKFGQHISSAWESVFSIVIEIPKLRSLELFRCAFVTLELICSDFLDNLPYSCVFSLTLCLDEFSKQDIDLNTSFTSVSLFWSVCDHLMLHDGIASSSRLEADKIKSESDLVNIVRSQDEDHDDMALWLLAVIKLSSIAGAVKQHQVKTSAIQIFLRIFNTHGPQLPQSAWDIAHRIAFQNLLFSARASSAGASNFDLEVYTLIVEGISRIDLLFLPKFCSLESFQKFWSQWIVFLDESAKVSPFVAASVYKNLKLILESKNATLVSNFSFYDFWRSQNPLPAYAAQLPKPTADSLRELVSMYPLVCGKNPEHRTAELELICRCALFPYYTQTLPPVDTMSYHMSSLQQICTSTLETIEVTCSWEILSEYLLLLNRFVKAPYDLQSEVEESSVRTFKPNFTGLSMWAQEQLIKLIPASDIVAGEVAGEGSSEANMTKFPVDKISSPIISTMNTAIKESHSVKESTQIILKLVSLSADSNAHHSSELVQSVTTVLQVTNSVSPAGTLVGNSSKTKASQIVHDAIQFIDSLICSIKKKPIDASNWTQILDCLLESSVFYERSVHNMRYYKSGDATLTEALRFGTTDTPRAVNNAEISKFCLEKLCDLGCDGDKRYSVTAMDFFQKRAKAVLYQYIGDCHVLGDEPIRDILRSELICILNELVTHARISPSVVDLSMKNVLLEAISCPHNEFQIVLHDILASAY